jgi:hypothetical protein
VNHHCAVRALAPQPSSAPATIATLADGSGVRGNLLSYPDHLDRRLLFGLSPFDTVSPTGAAAFLTAVALGAAYRPARRASRLDPLAVPRME